jgi:hypothetical protein
MKSKAAVILPADKKSVLAVRSDVSAGPNIVIREH